MFGTPWKRANRVKASKKPPALDRVENLAGEIRDNSKELHELVMQLREFLETPTRPEGTA